MRHNTLSSFSNIILVLKQTIPSEEKKLATYTEQERGLRRHGNDMGSGIFKARLKKKIAV